MIIGLTLGSELCRLSSRKVQVSVADECVMVNLAHSVV